MDGEFLKGDFKDWFRENIVGDSIVERLRFGIWSILGFLLLIGLLGSFFIK